MAANGSQQRWQSVRRYLNQSRPALTRTAADLVAEWPHLEQGLIALPEWLPADPMPLHHLELVWDPAPTCPRVTGVEPGGFLVRPLRADGQRYASYAEALGEVAPPALFEDRPCYRLLAVETGAAGGVRLTCGPAQYFDLINIAEAVAHELAMVCMGTQDRGRRSYLDRTDLPLRTLIGEPGDLPGRTVVPALCALTLRHDRATGEASFLLHWRDPERVASAGGMHQVAPVGVFQPAGAPRDPAAPAVDPDFDVWRCLARELSEELLGAAEHHGVDYTTWPFLQRLSQAREDGGCRPYYLGFGVDPLTLTGDLMTVLVFDAPVFDELFADVAAGKVTDNEEGRLVSMDDAPGGVGVPFTEEMVTRYARAEPMQPAGAALLERAWQRRDVLLG